MAKRAAANYMTDQNWQDEEEPVEAGTFTAASIDVIQKRQIKTAKRKIPNGGQATVSAFKGFSGFTSLTANKPAASAPSFNFGIAATGGASTAAKSDFGGASVAAKSDFGGGSVVNKTNNDPPLTTTSKTNDSSNAKYVQQLKRLNESVTQWIKDHVDRNPYCILTPIFRDYERYLDDLEKSTNCSESVSASSSSSASSTTTPTFKFGSAPLGGASDSLKPLGASSQSSISSIPGDNSKFGLVSGFNSQPLRETSDSANVAPFTGFGSPSLSGFGKPSSTVAAPTSLFSFKAETAKASLEAKSSSSFTFAVSKSETDSKSSATGQSSQSDNGGEEEYEPPKADVTVIKEDDAFYSKRCKLFVQRDNSWKEKGVGNLHLKPCSGKTQLLIRADTSLGTIMLNIMLSSSMPMSRQGKNNVTIICVPNPPLDDDNKPVSMLVKVKTGEDADELLEKLTEAKSQS